MDSIRIDRDIPIPAGHKTSPFSAALGNMSVGDSIETAEFTQKLPSLRTRATLFANTSGRKFSWRGSRVWRVA